MEQKRLVLAEFKAIYKALKTGTTWVDHLLLGLLLYLEGKFIGNRVKTEVDKALEEVVLPPTPDMVSPIYTERPSKTSTRLPEMRVTAPWYDDTVSERKGP